MSAMPCFRLPSSTDASPWREWLATALTGALPVLTSLLVLAEMPAWRPPAPTQGAPLAAAPAPIEMATAAAGSDIDAQADEQPPTF